MTATRDDMVVELRRERDEALAQRSSAYSERIEHQAATIDVLKAMSASYGDAQPVFDLIASRARDICGGYGVSVLEFDGALIHLRANTGVSEDPSIREAYEARFPRAPDGMTSGARAILERRVIRVDDLDALPGLATRLDGTVKSSVAVPVLRGDVAIGALVMGSRERGGFSDTQIELLKTFAEQAVIAITSAEMYRALQTRTAELQQSLEYQAATIDVLKIMSTSIGDTQPVFDTILNQAMKLCGCMLGGLVEFDGTLMHIRAAIGFDPERLAAYSSQFPRPPTRATGNGRAILDRTTQYVRDTLTDVAITPAWRALGHRSSINVPLLRGETVIGVIAVAHKDVDAFTDAHIELLKTFAEQAVIAIGGTANYRALETRTADLQESLEYQTATSEVLKVIGRSTFDLQPVLDTVVETAARLCDAEMAVLTRSDGDHLRMMANHGFPPAYEAHQRSRGLIPRMPDSPSAGQRAWHERRAVHIHDAATIPGYPEASLRLAKQRTTLAVPLMRDGEPIGTLSLARQRVAPFTDRQIELISTFADQAVIAIENTRLLTEQREALEQQTATAEVLQVINSSPGELAPVFETMLERAMRLCGAAFGELTTFDGDIATTVAVSGVSAEFSQLRVNVQLRPGPGTSGWRIMHGENTVHIADLTDTDAYRTGDPVRRMLVDVAGARALLAVALRKDGTPVGLISIFRRELGAFSDRQIALLENFAAQAVIAMENARLLTEQREALEQQTAIADVLRAINATPGELAPVFDVIGEKAIKLCDAAAGALMLPDGDRFSAVALGGVPEAYAEFCRNSPAYGRPNPGSLPARMLAGDDVVHIKDITDVDEYPSANTPSARALAELGGGRTLLGVALRKDDKFFGMITIFRQAVRPFSDRQVVLLQSFADQAVIAMENARLLEEVRQRQEELRITFENMGDGVAMFDEKPHLVAWNSKFQEFFNVPDGLLAEHRTYAEYVRYLAERGDYGADIDVEDTIRQIAVMTGVQRTYERVRPDGRVIEIRNNPATNGGFVLMFSDITQRKRNEEAIRTARDAAEAALRELRTAQANLIQAEKMASLGQLTAGIAHEIKNPLNFVNNFAALSVDLLAELKEAAAPGFAALTEAQRAEIDDVSAMLTGNLQKIAEYGKRADGIVKAMLEHSRGSSGERRMVDLNALVDEALNLAYHGARAQDQSFNITLERDFGTAIAPVELNPQDMTRVFLNIFTNGFYAASKRALGGAQPGFDAILQVATRVVDDAVEIRVRDNGTGIPEDIRDKLFQPFFTTKPTGEGTGLGLSITYDIVTKAHGGTITVDSEVGAFTEFVVTLPRRMFANGETSQ